NEAVRGQALDVAWRTEPLPQPAATFCEFPEGEQGQLTASCCTVNVWPATVIVPLRAAPVLAAALNEIDPLPLPDAALVMLTQFALLVAVQEQPLPAVTVTVPVPPPADTDWLAGAIE